MPELPEVEIVARHLKPLLTGRRIESVMVLKPKVLRPTAIRQLVSGLKGAVFADVGRRGKYLLFDFRKTTLEPLWRVVGHLGMTGRMFLQDPAMTLPRHAAVVLRLGSEDFVFEDVRGFGRFTFDDAAIACLGPEPLSREFTRVCLDKALGKSTQPVKVKLLDQRVAAGVGNIYASEALFRAGISPRTRACDLNAWQVASLREAIRETLREAIREGSTVALNGPRFRSAGLFYFGETSALGGSYEKRLRVYGRSGEPCRSCGTGIERVVQAGRSTFYCPNCQRGGRKKTKSFDLAESGL